MKPILFNTKMVRAILDGRKKVTRRLVKDKDIINAWDCEDDGTPIAYIDQETGDSYPPTHPFPYRPGDILYVRETWTHTCIHCEHYPDMFFCPPDCGTCPEFAYKADGISLDGWPDKRWRPSIHMPREAARIFLQVTRVRVERLQDITALEIEKEGVRLYDDICRDESWHPSFYDPDSGGSPSLPLGFSKLWDNTIKKSDRAIYGWEANPWVWVIEFERVEKTINDKT